MNSESKNQQGIEETKVGKFPPLPLGEGWGEGIEENGFGQGNAPHPSAAPPPSPGGRRVTPNTPLFVKTHDFTLWLLRHTRRFPKQMRHSYTNRLETAAFEFEEALLMANSARGPERGVGRKSRISTDLCQFTRL